MCGKIVCKSDSLPLDSRPRLGRQLQLVCLAFERAVFQGMHSFCAVCAQVQCSDGCDIGAVAL
jgi:hypothetical protein